jgi:hypothetical protein
MHAIWDTPLVVLADNGSDDFAGDLINQFQSQAVATQNVLDPAQMAAESFGIAKSQIYPKTIPLVPVVNQFFNALPGKCATTAAPQVNKITIDAKKSFQNQAALTSVRLQLYRGGMRLAAILNSL